MVGKPGERLAGRVALVTGASSGIGAHLARVLALAGASVALCARRSDALADVCREIEQAGGRAVAVTMDVSDEASVVAGFDAAEAAFGTVDTIIANAGITVGGRTVDQPIEEFDRVIAINLRGAFLTAREGARRLLAKPAPERGRVVLIASVTANKVDPGLAAYSASKAGVVQMGKVMAREWSRMGINVNMILPGYIRTDLNRDWFDTEGGAKQVAGFARRRLMEPGDLDEALLFLTSDGARAVTGAVLTIDDAQSL